MHTAESERLKYERVFAFPGYGNMGHALKYAHLLVKRAPRGSTVGDFGCGRGASFEPFLAAGLKILPVDHVDVLPGAKREKPGVGSFTLANLWSDQLPRVDYGVCTDVMEHIPPDYVDVTLRNIAHAVRVGCLWSICHVADVWGKRIGDSLHLTIKPREWWTEQLKTHWGKVEEFPAGRGTTYYWTQHGN